MGSSSILAGCALASMERCFGISFDKEVGKMSGLTRAVLLLEQYLTTGGGWQDQMGGLVSALLDGIVHIISFIHTLTC